MMDSPLVSVIIPTYNRERSVIVTLQSIISQTYDNVEVWVVDDGSTDNTEDEVLSFIANTPTKKKIKYIKQLNSGAPKARNNGFHHSRGKYVIFFDSDDEMLPNRIEMQVNSMIVENSDACTAGYDVYCNSVKVKSKRNYVWSGESPLDNWLMFYVKGRGYLGGTQAWMYKREIIEQVGGYDELMQRSQDLDLNFRVLSIPNIKISVVDASVTIFNNDDRPERIMKSVWKSEKALSSEKRLMTKIFSCDYVLSHPSTFRKASFFYLRSYVKNAIPLKGIRWAYDEYLFLKNVDLSMSLPQRLLCRLNALWLFIISVIIVLIKKKV